MKRSHLITVVEASRICGLTPRQIRGLIDRGEVAGVVTGTVRRTYRVVLFAVYRSILGYPEEVAMRLVAAHLGEIDSNAALSLRVWNGRRSPESRNRPGQSGASSQRMSGDRENGSPGTRQRRPPYATNRPDDSEQLDPATKALIEKGRAVGRQYAG